MLSTVVYKDLGRLMQVLSLLERRITEGAAYQEVAIHIQTAAETLQPLAHTIEATETESVEKLRRHLHWIGYRHRRGEHDKYQGDLQDIRQWDLPGLITEVNEWERRLLSEGLVDAVEASWQVGNFRNAVQDAFIYLEEALRGVGQIPRTEGMTANALVDRLLAPNSSDRIHLSGMSPQGPQTSGEQQGVMLLFKAAFLLFRNAVGHRFIAYTPEQADDVIRLVSLCLRILGTEHTRPVVINVPVANWTETIARQVKVLIEKYPGRSSIYLHLTDDGKTTILRLGDEYRVQPTPDLFRELKGLLTDMEVLENDDFPDSRSAGGPPT